MVYVFLADGFEEIEAIAPIDMLRRAKREVVCVGVGSAKTDGVVTSARGVCVKTDISIDEFVLSDECEMLILPGGMPGTLNLKANESVRTAINACAERGIYIAAICAAPSILGEMGLLKGFKAVCYPGFEKSLIGAQILPMSVVHDRNIITAVSAGASIEFALKLVEVLDSRAKAAQLYNDINPLKDKTNLRKMLSAARKTCQERESKDKVLFQKLVCCDAFINAKTVLCYMSVNDEIDTKEIVNYCLSQKKKVALPRVDEGKINFFYINDFKDLEVGFRGIPAPSSDCEIVSDYRDSVCIVPALAFDRKNHRIGYGGGFYDRFLKDYPGIKIGLCYSSNFVDELPTQEHDVPVDLLIREDL